ncbi:MAG TPA: CehA/McbA family metallohydrolase [Acidisarcina sp.]|nr:CehA/McbA family metallohydrolase [Acidisarcina sp.]
MPSGTGRITVELSYTGKEDGVVLNLGIWDTERFRGWGGGKRGPITISETDATPSYLSGAIPAGTWTLLLGIPYLPENVTAQYTARVQFDEPPAFSPAVRTGAGWYRGDLHMHDAHSDGTCESRNGKNVSCPLFKTLESAAARGLDFVAITDHNTISQYNDLRELAPYFDNMLLMHGREITTYQGHANVYGTDRFIDFRIGSPEVANMNALLRQVRDAKAIISINHPAHQSGHHCLGCGWTPPDFDPGLIQAVEVVNGGNPAGIPFWQQLLNRGFHIAGIGGSDNHNPIAFPPPGPGSIGYPTTVIYARELSEDAIIDGIRAGHVFVDLEGSRDRRLEMTGHSGSATAMMGDALKVRAGEEIPFNVHIAHAVGARLEIIQDGAVRDDLATSIGSEDESHTFIVRADANHHWIRANVRAADGKLLLIGNPIYFEF